MPTMRNMNPK